MIVAFDYDPAGRARVVRVWKDEADMASAAPLVLDVQAAEIAKLDLRPGDAVILRYPGPLDPGVQHYLQEALGRFFPDHRCLVLPEGMALEVVRPDCVAEVMGG